MNGHRPSRRWSFREAARQTAGYRRGTRPEAGGEQDKDGPGVGISPLPGEDASETLGDPEQQSEGRRHDERRADSRLGEDAAGNQRTEHGENSRDHDAALTGQAGEAVHDGDDPAGLAVGDRQKPRDRAW